MAYVETKFSSSKLQALIIYLPLKGGSGVREQ
jgi:hypothetical protein